MSRSSKARRYQALGALLLAGAGTAIGLDIFAVSPEPNVAKIAASTSTQTEQLIDVDLTSARSGSRDAIVMNDAGKTTKVSSDMFCTPVRNSDIGKDFTITTVRNPDAGKDFTITRVGNSTFIGTCSPEQIADKNANFQTSALPEGGLRFGIVLLLVGGAASFTESARRNAAYTASRTSRVTTRPTPARTTAGPITPKAVAAPTTRPGHVVRASDRASVLRGRAEALLASGRGQTLDAWEQAMLRTLSGGDLDDAVRLYRDATGEGTSKQTQRQADAALNEQLLRIESEIARLDEVAQQRMLQRQNIHSTYLGDKLHKSELDL